MKGIPEDEMEGHVLAPLKSFRRHGEGRSARGAAHNLRGCTLAFTSAFENPDRAGHVALLAPPVPVVEVLQIIGRDATAYPEPCRKPTVPPQSIGRIRATLRAPARRTPRAMGDA